MRDDKPRHGLSKNNDSVCDAKWKAPVRYELRRADLSRQNIHALDSQSVERIDKRFGDAGNNLKFTPPMVIGGVFVMMHT